MIGNNSLHLMHSMQPKMQQSAMKRGSPTAELGFDMAWKVTSAAINYKILITISAIKNRFGKSGYYWQNRRNKRQK